MQAFHCFSAWGKKARTLRDPEKGRLKEAKRLISWALPVMALFAFALAIPAQTIPQSRPARAPAGNRKSDLSGIWWQEGIGNSLSYRRFSMEEPPLQPWAMEQYKANRAGAKAPNDKGRDELDPRFHCFPAGTPRIMVMNYPFEIVQRQDQVYILFEYDHGIRRIYTDGRGHPDSYPFGWMGHSIGKWIGDTLVADTIHLNDKTWLDRAGTPHSADLHVVERFRRVKPDTLEIEFQFTDPKAYTKPWGGKLVYHPWATQEKYRKPNSTYEMTEYVPCEEYLDITKFREGPATDK